ncbi:hypothetical protein T484DRAFT_1871365, partial [Baffinella frigidus]
GQAARAEEEEKVREREIAARQASADRQQRERGAHETAHARAVPAESRREGRRSGQEEGRPPAAPPARAAVLAPGGASTRSVSTVSVNGSLDSSLAHPSHLDPLEELFPWDPEPTTLAPPRAASPLPPPPARVVQPEAARPPAKREEVAPRDPVHAPAGAGAEAWRGGGLHQEPRWARRAPSEGSGGRGGVERGEEEDAREDETLDVTRTPVGAKSTRHVHHSLGTPTSLMHSTGT